MPIFLSKAYDVSSTAKILREGLNRLDAMAFDQDMMEDPRAEGESRWLLVSMSNQVRLLTVVYTLREDNPRLISARKATTKEAKSYAT